MYKAEMFCQKCNKVTIHKITIIGTEGITWKTFRVVVCLTCGYKH